MENWLVSHAHSNIWCMPSNDNRWIIKPGRLSAPEGETYGMKVQRYSIRLPVDGKWFHVFQFGSLPHTKIGIEYIPDKWISAKTILNTSGTLFTIYNADGRTLPVEYAYFRKQPNGNVIIAVQRDEMQVDFSTDALYIRFYNGTFKGTTEYTDDHKCRVTSQSVTTAAERQDMVAVFDSYRNDLPGEPIAYVNGYEVDNLTVADMNIWDFVEIVYDGLVETIEYFTISDLLTYTSELDETRKYLIHPEKQVDSIYFINDIDLSILKGGTGRYYHQNQAMSLRQVTHNDYSIPARRINEYINNIADWNEVGELVIKLTRRYSGMDRPLVYTSNKLQELYKLTDAQIESAMAGINSNVAEWQASNLEQSSYNRIMASKYMSVTNELATDAYGYNAVAKYAANTPNKTYVENGNIVATIAPLLARSCTVYEYSEDGELLGYYNHSSDVTQQYTCSNSDTYMIECIEGQGGKILDIVWDATDLVMNKAINYRFYTNVLLSGELSDDFEDVTGTDAYSVEDDGTVVWNIDLTRRQPIALLDTAFLTYGMEVALTDGVAKFSIDHWFDETNYKPLPFEPETLEIWMNGKSLVPEIDYFYEWPQIVICNKSHLEDGADRKTPWVDIRCRGLASAIRKPKTGFIVDNLLSNDSYYDLRDDKVVQINVGGKCYHRDDLLFREDAAVGISTIANGLPWMVNDATIPLRDLVSDNTYVLRDASRDVDSRVEAYLTNLIPTPDNIDHNAITAAYSLFSPIMNKVIHDMTNNLLDIVADDELYYVSTQQFDELMEPYIYLLAYEPTLSDMDLRYVNVEPHDGNDIISLTPIQMTVIERINDRYLNNKVIINRLLNIKA